MYIDDLIIALLMLAGVRIVGLLVFLSLLFRRYTMRYCVLSAAWFIYMIGPLIAMLNYNLGNQILNIFYPFTAACATMMLTLSIALFIWTLSGFAVTIIISSFILLMTVLYFLLTFSSGFITIAVQGIFILAMLFIAVFNRRLFRKRKAGNSFIWLCVTLLLGFFHTIGFNLFLSESPLSLRFTVTALINLSLLVFFIFLDWEKAHQEIQLSLKEKEILLQEVHHRVKNNLAIITSILHLQSENIKDAERIEIINSIENRINTMALVHEHLYKSKDFKRILIEDYLTELMEGIQLSMYHESKPVLIKHELIPAYFNLNVLIPIGMFVNEVVTNSYKHAFKNTEVPEISIKLEYDETGYCILSISDNGDGFDEEKLAENMQSTGLVIIEALAQQLQAELFIDNKKGTEFRLKMPLEAFDDGRIKKIKKKQEKCVENLICQF